MLSSRELTAYKLCSYRMDGPALILRVGPTSPFPLGPLTAACRTDLRPRVLLPTASPAAPSSPTSIHERSSMTRCASSVCFSASCFFSAFNRREFSSCSRLAVRKLTTAVHDSISMYSVWHYGTNQNRDEDALYAQVSEQGQTELRRAQGVRRRLTLRPADGGRLLCYWSSSSSGCFGTRLPRPSRFLGELSAVSAVSAPRSSLIAFNCSCSRTTNFVSRIAVLFTSASPPLSSAPSSTSPAPFSTERARTCLLISRSATLWESGYGATHASTSSTQLLSYWYYGRGSCTGMR